MNSGELKSVSRSDLRSSLSPSRSPSPLPSLPFEYEFTNTPAVASAPAVSEPQNDAAESSEDEFAFSLFSSRPATKLTLRSPTPDIDPFELAARNQKRPESYYFHVGLKGEELGVAVDGVEVKRFAERCPWTADRKPWRIIQGHIGPKLAEQLNIQLSKLASTTTTTSPTTKRKKPSKKRRLQIRLAARKKKEEEEAKKRAEEHKKEKARRKNQQRKGKRREKAKLARKAAAGGATEGDTEMADGGSTVGMGEKEEHNPDAMEE